MSSENLAYEGDYVGVEQARATGVIPLRAATFVRGEGAFLWDPSGKRYLDCRTGSGVAFLGHCHPVVTEAIQRQAAELVTLPASYPHPLRARFFDRLFAVTPAGLDRVFLQNSGAESIDAALKFARLATGRTGIVAAKRSFHGRTMGALSVTFNPKYRKPFAPLIPDVSHVAYGKLDQLQAAVDENTAAVLLEPIQGEGGVHTPPPGYLKAVQEVCHERGALLIMDEIQTGIGRTGDWFASTYEGIQPDIVAIGKIIGGGVPAGGTIVGERVQGFFLGAHGSTYSGNLLAVAAAEAVLRVIEEEGLIERARALGETMRQAIEGLPDAAARHITAVRGRGLMWGVQLDMKGGPIINAMLEEGIVVLPAGPKVVRFLPPVVADEADLVGAIEVMGRLLARV